MPTAGHLLQFAPRWRLIPGIRMIDSPVGDSRIGRVLGSLRMSRRFAEEYR